MRIRNLARRWQIGAAAALVFATAGVSLAATQKAGGPFTVRVLPASPPTWSYTVVSQGQNEIASVEIHAESTLSDCTITADRLGFTVAAHETEAGHDVVLAAANTKRLTASLNCPGREQGEVYLKVTDAGGISRMIGPIEGPK